MPALPTALAGRLPAANPESVRPFDAAADRARRAPDRLRGELLEVLLAAGADHHGTYTLVPDPGQAPEQGSLDDVVFDIGWFVGQALNRDPHDTTSHDVQAGQDAVGLLVVLLRERLEEVGYTPNPLGEGEALDAATLLERAGGEPAWTETVGHDRPLLVIRRIVTRALDPGAPIDIYRPWWS